MSTEPITVRVLGSLRPYRTNRGLPYEFTYSVPAEGMPARELVAASGIPPDEVEGVFVNHTVHGIGVRVRPGDRIAFVPADTPGPHRVFLGLYAAGKEDEDEG